MEEPPSPPFPGRTWSNGRMQIVQYALFLYSHLYDRSSDVFHLGIRSLVQVGLRISFSVINYFDNVRGHRGRSYESRAILNIIVMCFSSVRGETDHLYNVITWTLRRIPLYVWNRSIDVWKSITDWTRRCCLPRSKVIFTIDIVSPSGIQESSNYRQRTGRGVIYNMDCGWNWLFPRYPSRYTLCHSVYTAAGETTTTYGIFLPARQTYKCASKQKFLIWLYTSACTSNKTNRLRI